MKKVLVAIAQGFFSMIAALSRLIGAVVLNAAGRVFGKILAVALVLGLVLFLLSPASLLRFLGFDRATTRSVGTIVQGIHGMSQLATAEFEGQTDSEVSKEHWLPFLPGERLLLRTRGTIIAGIDLGQITEEDVSVDDTAITVVLPPAHIISKDLEHVQIAVDGGLFSSDIDPSLQPLAEEQGRQELIKAACSANLLYTAEQNARAALTKFLGNFGFATIRYVQEPSTTGGGGC